MRYGRCTTKPKSCQPIMSCFSRKIFWGSLVSTWQYLNAWALLLKPITISHNGPAPCQIQPHSSSSPPLGLPCFGLAEHQSVDALQSLPMLYSFLFDKLLPLLWQPIRVSSPPPIFSSSPQNSWSLISVFPEEWMQMFILAPMIPLHVFLCSSSPNKAVSFLKARAMSYEPLNNIK